MTVTLVNANADVRRFYGLSSDTKPTTLPAQFLGALFDEMDTGRRFTWNGSAWVRLIIPGLGIGPMYYYRIASQVHVAAANTIHWDMFNADASLIVRVLSILQIPNIVTAVTGVAHDWSLERTTSVGTTGSAQTAWLPDLNAAALDADITCRSKPGGGAAGSTTLYAFSISSEETDAGVIQIAARGGLELVPPSLRPDSGGAGIVLRQNQGLRMMQNTNTAQGNTGWLIGFTVE